MIPFVKSHALGNDFILVAESDKVPQDLVEFAKRICHRNFGIGGDGVVLWAPAGEIFKIRIFNQDGSEAECSGNGLRCMAAYLIESGEWPNDEIRLETVSGLYTLRRKEKQYEADMGTPHLIPAEIPFVPPLPMETVVNYSMAV